MTYYAYIPVTRIVHNHDICKYLIFTVTTTHPTLQTTNKQTKKPFLSPLV